MPANPTAPAVSQAPIRIGRITYAVAAVAKAVTIATRARGNDEVAPAAARSAGKEMTCCVSSQDSIS
jgi:hypothetical protein